MIKSAVHFRLYLLLFIFVGAVLLTGCAEKPAMTASNATAVTAEASAATALPDEATATPAPTTSPTATPETQYKVVGTKILGENSKLIYDAAPYYTDARYTAITGLADDGEALYLSEGGPKAEYNPEVDPYMTYAIVRIDYDGQNRKEITSKYDLWGYENLTVFGDRLFYIDDVDTRQVLSDISKDGKDKNVIDWGSFAARTGAEPDFMYATFTQDNDYLYVHFTNFEGQFEQVEREARIDKNMTLEDMPLKEDQYLTSGSKIILLDRVTGDKNVIYDASDYYDCDAVIDRYIKTDVLFILNEIAYKDGVDTSYSIVMLDKQGRNRKVLASNNRYWYMDMVLFNNAVVFVENRTDSRQIGYVPLTCGEVTYINLTPEQQKDSYRSMVVTERRLQISMNSAKKERVYNIYVDEDFKIEN